MALARRVGRILRRQNQMKTQQPGAGCGGEFIPSAILPLPDLPGLGQWYPQWEQSKTQRCKPCVRARFNEEKKKWIQFNLSNWIELDLFLIGQKMSNQGGIFNVGRGKFDLIQLTKKPKSTSFGLD